MRFTGERAITDKVLGSKRFADHTVRYTFAKKFTKGKVVLDIACGSGYGTRMIGQNANRVTGGDISLEAVEYSRGKDKNITFVVADGTELPFKSKAFDVVVSFETIEHIHDYRKFIRELRRVLKPKGTLIISTPNYRGEIWKNKYHVSNLSHEQFENAVGKVFSKREVFYQGKFFYVFPGRGILESLLGIKRDITIRKKKPAFEHSVSIIVAS